MILKQTGKLAPKDKPWQLIREAIHDLELQEETEGVKICMADWHRPSRSSSNTVCRQCLSGAVMSRRLGVDLSVKAAPTEFDAETADKLMALENFRVGFVHIALRRLRLPLHPGVPKDYSIPDYHSDPDAFKRGMLHLANLLEFAFKQEEFYELKNRG